MTTPLELWHQFIAVVAALLHLRSNIIHGLPNKINIYIRPFIQGASKAIDHIVFVLVWDTHNGAADIEEELLDRYSKRWIQPFLKEPTGLFLVPVAQVATCEGRVEVFIELLIKKSADRGIKLVLLVPEVVCSH